MHDSTHEDFASVRLAMDNFQVWFQQTLDQPYTVAEMVANLHHFFNLHFWYFTNNPVQMPEKMERIFAIENRLRQDFFSRTQVFSAGLSTAEIKNEKLKAEIALFEHPFLFYMQGRYYNDGFEMVIPTAMMMLADGHSPYFEFVFDEDMAIKKENGGQDFFRFLSDVYYLQFLQDTLANLELTSAGDMLAFSGNTVVPKFDSFEDVFRVKKDFKKVVEYLKSKYMLDDDGMFIEGSGKKKDFVILVKVLRKTSKLKPVYDAEIAELLRRQFKISSLSPDYLSKSIPDQEESFEEMRRALRF